MSSTTVADAPIQPPISTSAPTVTPPAPPPSTPAEPKPKKKTTRRPKLVANKRRGAKVEEEDEAEDEKATVEIVASDSDTDEEAVNPLVGDDDDEDEDDEDREAGKDAIPPSSTKDSSTVTLVEIVPSSSITTETTKIAPLVPPIEIHPSWADLTAAEGLAGNGDLPTLDFAKLDAATLEAIPTVAAVTKSPATGISNPNSARPPLKASASSSGPPSDAKTKKAQLLAKREAKSAAAKEKDPVAWEAAEVERKKKELEKKKEKKEKLKEKKKLIAVANVEGASTAATDVTAPPASSSQGPATIPPPASAPRVKAPRPSAPSRPSRTAVNLGLVPPPATNESAPSTSAASEPPSTSNPPSGIVTRPNPINNNRGPPMANPHYREAADLYADRMTNPSATPRVGRFYSHDARLALPEERPLNAYWRGRGRGGEMHGGGFQIRGRGRGGRGGGEGGLGRVITTGGWNQATQTGDQSGEEAGASSDKGKAKIVQEISKNSDDDGWGRGEANRPIVSSITPETFPLFPEAVTGWKHDGFEELDQDESKAPAVVSIRGRGRGRGGAVAGNRNGAARTDISNAGAVAGRVGGERVGTPGSINPRFANLPFHPLHRFPASPSNNGTSNNSPSPITNPDESVLASQVVPDEQTLFAKTETIVRLPSSSASPSTSTVPLVNLPLAQTSTPITPAEFNPLTTKAEAQSSVLYAADPSRAVSSAPEAKSAVSREEPVLPSIQQGRPHPPAPPSAYYQLPPHLQPSSSPVNYSNVPQSYQPQQQYYPQQFYSPDSFPNMPTPGVTPPPLFNPSHSPAPFFAPPRQSKIEIKAPGPSHSPANSLSAPRSALSASGDAFAPRQFQGGVPASSFYDGRQGQGQGQGMGPESGFVAVESGGIVYFVQSPQAQVMQQQQQQQQQQRQHNGQQQQGVPTGYYNPYNQVYPPQHLLQQQYPSFPSNDPAILSVTSPNAPNSQNSTQVSGAPVPGPLGSLSLQQQQQYYGNGTPPSYYTQQGGQLPPPAVYGRENYQYQ